MTSEIDLPKRLVVVNKSEEIDPKEWDRKVQKGENLYRQFALPVEHVPQSKWTGWNSIAATGWIEVAYTTLPGSDVDSETYFPFLDEFFKENGYDTSLDDWQEWTLSHEDVYNDLDGNVCEPTFAIFSMWQYTKDITSPVWIASQSWSPAHTLHTRDYLKGRTMPELHQWSDIAALVYYNHNGGSEAGIGTVRPPRWIIQSDIVPDHTDTQEVIRKTFHLAEKPLLDWPGIDVFPEGETAEAYAALLGSAHGHGPAYFLTQHKAWFGNTKIDRIKIFVGAAQLMPRRQEYYMIFSIVPVTMPLLLK